MGGEQQVVERHRRAVAAALAVAILAGMGLIAWALARGLSRGHQLPPPVLKPRSGKSFHYDWRIADLDGNEHDMAEFRGKVLVINFWAHWCPPCVAEMPSIQRLYQQVTPEGIVVLPIFVDSPAETRRFMRESQLDLPVYRPLTGIPDDLMPQAIPATYVVSREGEVVTWHVGGASWDDESVVEFLRSLAGREASGED